MRVNFLKPKAFKIDQKELESVLRTREQQFANKIGSGKWEQNLRSMNLDLAVNYAVLTHLGILPVDDLEVRLHLGVDRAKEYFLGVWWKSNETDRVYMDKKDPNAALIWSREYLYTCVLCGLTNRWEELSEVSQWLDDDVLPQGSFDPQEDAYSLVYLYVASRLRSIPLSIEPELKRAIENAKSKGPRLQLAAFDSAERAEQSAFEKLLRETLSHCEKYEVEDVGNFNYWIGLFQSFICAIAMKNNLCMPKLPPNLGALVLTRSSIGLL